MRLRYLDGSLPRWFAPPGRFDSRTFRYVSGRFATSLKIWNLRYCKNFFCRPVAKRPGIETSKDAKRPGSASSKVHGSETSRWRTGNVAKRPVTEVGDCRCDWSVAYHVTCLLYRTWRYVHVVWCLEVAETSSEVVDLLNATTYIIHCNRLWKLGREETSSQRRLTYYLIARSLH